MPKVMNKEGIEKLGKEYTHRELEIETEGEYLKYHYLETLLKI